MFTTVFTIVCLIGLLWIIVYGCAYMIGLGFTQGMADAIIGVVNKLLPAILGGMPV